MKLPSPTFPKSVSFNTNNLAFLLVCNTFVMAICFIVSPIMICMGSIYIEQCPKQPYIPIFLIVAGSLNIINIVVNLFVNRLAGPEVNTEEQPDKLIWAFANLLNGLSFSWYIAGCTWVYGAFIPTFEYQENNYFNFCHKTLYLFAFCLISGIFSAIGIVLLYCLVALIFGICTKHT